MTIDRFFLGYLVACALTCALTVLVGVWAGRRDRRVDGERRRG